MLPLPEGTSPLLLVLVSIRGHAKLARSSRRASAHARGQIASLLDAMAETLGTTLVPVRREADGFWAVQVPSELKAAEFLEALERMGDAFQGGVAWFVATNRCGCEACEGLKKLRLKVTLHHAAANLRSLPGGMELTGAGLNQALAFRDNDLQVDSHILYTQEAQRLLGTPEEGDPLPVADPEGVPTEAWVRGFECHASQAEARGWDRFRVALRKWWWELRG